MVADSWFACFFFTSCVQALEHGRRLPGEPVAGAFVYAFRDQEYDASSSSSSSSSSLVAHADDAWLRRVLVDSALAPCVWTARRLLSSATVSVAVMRRVALAVEAEFTAALHSLDTPLLSLDAPAARLARALLAWVAVAGILDDTRDAAEPDAEHAAATTEAHTHVQQCRNALAAAYALGVLCGESSSAARSASIAASDDVRVRWAAWVCNSWPLALWPPHTHASRALCASARTAFEAHAMHDEASVRSICD